MGITKTNTIKITLLKGTTTMAKNNDTTKKDKAVVVVKVAALATMALASLYMTGLLNVGDIVAHVLGYGLMIVTLYFALSIVK